MTQKEKAELCDKAYDKVAARFGLNVAKEIFTDLYESEDEKIKKDVYNYLYNERHNIRQLTPYTDELDRWLAWLEKQKPINISIEDKRIKKSLINYVKAHGNGGDFTKEKFIAWLEKQGEQKPVNDTDEDIVEAVKDTSILDMIEPKFKVGDWVMLDRPVLITKVEDMPYNTYQYWTSDGTWFGNGTNAKLWTIEDAKDGDVLIDKSGSREGPFIFKETKPSDIKTDILNPLAVLGYCGIGGAGFTKGSGWGDTANCIYYPATKEQRDTLMKAMADAGWEFDFEKKELKKIEQKPAWSEEDENNLYLITTAVEQKYSGELFLGRKQKEIVCTGRNLLDWLYSLKDRVQPNQWKPSKEQIETLEYYMLYLTDCKQKEVLFGLYDQLMKLNNN